MALVAAIITIAGGGTIIRGLIGMALAVGTIIQAVLGFHFRLAIDME